MLRFSHVLVSLPTTVLLLACAEPSDTSPAVVYVSPQDALDDTPDAVADVARGPDVTLTEVRAETADDSAGDATTDSAPELPPPPPCTPASPTHRVSYTDVTFLVEARCAGTICHVNGSGAAGLDMSPGLFHQNTVWVDAKNSSLYRIAAGAPFESHLYLKLLGQGSGNRMPPNGNYLTDAQLEVFRHWIEDCAVKDAVAGQPTGRQ